MHLVNKHIASWPNIIFQQNLLSVKTFVHTKYLPFLESSIDEYGLTVKADGPQKLSSVWYLAEKKKQTNVLQAFDKNLSDVAINKKHYRKQPILRLP